MDTLKSVTVAPCTASQASLAFADPDAALAQLGRYTADLKRLVRERDAMLQQIEHAHLNSLTLLCRTAEYRDDDTGTHMDRVGAMAELLTRLIGRSEAEVRMIRMAAPMHDIGKIAIPDAVLKKPGAYSSEERRIMNNHTVLGAEILGQSDIPVFRMAADVALTHHERWDGSGYPAGLRGTQIPWSGRVAAVIDFFDALTMDRVYRPAYSDEKALGMLREQRGRGFDPDLVDIFTAHADRFIQLRDDINAAAREYGAVLRPDAEEMADEMGL